MILFESTLSLVIIALMLALHILGGFLKGKWQTALNIFNIILHIALVAVLVFDAVPLDEAVLAYMASVLTYTLVRFIIYKRGDCDR